MTAFTRRAGILAAAAGPLLAAGRADAAPAAATAPLRTRSLADLTSMLGVCMMTSTTGGVWGQHDTILTALRDLGASWYRTPFSYGNKAQITWCRELGANGFALNPIMGQPGQTATP